MESVMDGSGLVETLTLESMVLEAMTKGLYFNALRRNVYKFLKSENMFLVGVDRIDGQIIIKYYKEGVIEAFTYTVTETNWYTIHCPISTW